jgi:hypothetical protein
MDIQAAKDRILETENLTDGLEDDDANWLLDWGIARVEALIAGEKDDDAAGEKVNDLMSLMRRLNQIAADRAAKSAKALSGDLRAFAEDYARIFGTDWQHDAAKVREASAAVKKQSPREAMEHLVNFAEGHITKEE